MEIGGRPESLHKRNGAVLSLVDTVVARHAAVKAEECADKFSIYRRHTQDRTIEIVYEDDADPLIRQLNLS